MIWLLVGYMWLFIHRPFEVWPWLGAYHIERVYVIVAVVYWAICAPKSWLACRSNIPVFLLAATLLFASQTSPYAGFAYVEDWFKIFVFYVLLVTFPMTERDLRILVVAFACIIGLYELHSLREFMCGRCQYEMGVKRLVGVDLTLNHPNSMGVSVDLGLPFLYPVWTICKRRWSKRAVWGALALGVVCVLLTGSRSSLVGLMALVLVAAMVSKYRWRILPVLLIAPPIIWMCLREDLRNRYFTLVDSSAGPENAKGSAEGRTKSFLDGLQSFAENPLFGAGMGSYRVKTGFATHNVYNEAMGELGLPGLLVLIGFAWAYWADLREARRLRTGQSDPDELFLYRTCVAAAGACALLFFLGYSGHNLMRFNWLWFGAFSGAAVHFLRQRFLDQQAEVGTYVSA